MCVPSNPIQSTILQSLIGIFLASRNDESETIVESDQNPALENMLKVG